MTTVGPATVLVVDDEPSSIAVLAGALQKAGFRVLTATGGQEAVRLAMEHAPELILLDLMMPDVGGVDVCQILKAHESTASIPIIFVTADTDKTRVLDAFSAGGCDYVTKPVRVDEILARVSVHVRLRRAEQDLLERNARIQQLAGELADINTQLAFHARRDPLTQLLNRRAWRESIEVELARAGRNATQFAIALLDIDNFKALNDTDGHAAGDDCLKRIALSLAKSCRDTDILARYGGEEFIVLAPDTDETGVRVLAERMRTDLWSLAIPHRASITADRVTLSVGAAMGSGRDPIDEVIQRADLALYRAKSSGRNRVVLDSDPQTESDNTTPAHALSALEAVPANAPPTVLVADDDAVSRKLCHGALIRLGYHVHEAADGLAALNDARAIMPDVIIMDVSMPGIDGLECTRRLKADRRTATIPVIIQSARDAETDIEAGLDAGADEYLLKPIRVHDLRARVRSMVRLRQEHKALLRATAAETAKRVLETELIERRRVEAELRTAKEKADAANVAKSEFLAVISHELRTPLHGVIGMTQLLLNTSLDADQRRFATVASKAADLLLGVINDVLDYSKIEAGGLELEHIPFDFSEFIANVTSMFADRAQAKGIEFSWGVHPQMPMTLLGDAVRLGQVLSNLVMNAIKFTSAGSVVMRAVVDEEGANDVILRFTVNDTGIGIPPDRVERLFSPFSQVDATTTRMYGGTGLGLAICKKLVNEMKGQIGVLSQPGFGSTFWFTVRLDKANQDVRPVEPNYADIRRLHLLVVSADGNCRSQIRAHLEGTGICVDEASSGDEARDQLTSAAKGRKPFGMALIDANHTPEALHALVQSIGHESSIRNTPLVVMGRSIESTDHEVLRREGFSGLLLLPTNREDLLEAIAAGLACAVSHGLPQEAGPSSSIRVKQPQGSPSRYRILVAEDNEMGQEVIRETLRCGGHACDIVADGEQAVFAVRERAYDLVLMDSMMPRMDGYEASRQIRKHEQQLEADGVEHVPIPIIALTANASADDRVRCLAAGMNDFLTKPVDLDRLLQVIDTHLGSRRQSDREGDHFQTASPGDGMSPQPVPDRGHFDQVLLDGEWNNNREVIHRLIDRFETELHARLQAAQSAVDVQDAAQLSTAAHSLKDQAGSVAAEKIKCLAAELEAMGLSGDLTHAEMCINAIAAEIKRGLRHAPTHDDKSHEQAL